MTHARSWGTDGGLLVCQQDERETESYDYRASRHSQARRLQNRGAGEEADAVPQTDATETARMRPGEPEREAEAEQHSRLMVVVW